MLHHHVLGREFDDLNVDEDVWGGDTGLHLPLLQSQVWNVGIVKLMMFKYYIIDLGEGVGIKYVIGRSDI